MTDDGLDAASGDFEKHFICGEIMAYEDLHEHGDEVAVRAVSLPLLPQYLLVLT